MVCIEDLQVRNMSKSAAGTLDNPGKNVRAKSGLNKSILDQGWFEFRRQLDYKLAWRGGWLVTVPPQNTSRTCPCCGHVSADNRQTQARFLCVECGFEENADLVGAINIPIIKFSVDWWNTLHQPASVLRMGGSTLDKAFLWPLLRSEEHTSESSHLLISRMPSSA